jgi:DNA invertase Pin-like site-specific DNA recombinase
MKHTDRPVASYARARTEDVVTTIAEIEDQVAHVTGWAEAYGYSIAGTYREIEKSTADPDRPELARMLADISKGRLPIKIVAIYSFNRLMGDMWRYEDLRRQLSAHGVKIVSVTQFWYIDSELTREAIAAFDDYVRKTRSQSRKIQLTKGEKK